MLHNRSGNPIHGVLLDGLWTGITERLAEDGTWLPVITPECGTGMEFTELAAGASALAGGQGTTGTDSLPPGTYRFAVRAWPSDDAAASFDEHWLIEHRFVVR